MTKFAISNLVPLALLRNKLPVSPRTGKPLDPSVLNRWVRRGLLTPDGRRVKLRAVKAGGAICSSLEFVEDFFSELSAEAGLSAPHNPTTDSTAAELIAVGLKRPGTNASPINSAN